MTAHRRSHRPGTIAAALAALVLSATCAPQRLVLPTGSGSPLADYTRIFEQASARCARVRTLTAELGISGRAGGTKLRGRVIAGFERPGALRLEAVAPFGAPVFVLAGKAGAATLVLERDNRVLDGADPAAILEALTGVWLAPDDLGAVLAGCVAADNVPQDGRAFGDRWARVQMPRDVTVYLHRTDAGWRIEAGAIGRVAVEYLSILDGVPREIRIDAGGNGAGRGQADLRISLSQVEINTAIDPAAFTVVVPRDAVPMTLDELREAGPLGRAGKQARAMSHEPRAGRFLLP